jgi:hypothetical protein
LPDVQRKGVSVALHPVDSANEHLRAFGYSAADVQVYSVFDQGGECALVRGAAVGERFVQLSELPGVVEALAQATRLDGPALQG